MGVQDPQRLRLLLGGPAWAWWRARARAHLEAGRPLPAQMTRIRPSDAERDAANRMFAQPGRQGPLVVVHARMLALLSEAGISDDLRATLEELDGPMRDRPAEQAALDEAWRRVCDAARAGMQTAMPSAADRLRDLAASGAVRRICVGGPEQAERLLRQATAVCAQLVRLRGSSLSMLAAAATGDAHALDRDRPLGRLVLRLLADADEHGGVLAWRSAWGGLGMQADQVSASVLVLNLRMRGTDALARLLAAAADAGEPVRLTARMLASSTGAAPQDAPCVSVCENPSILAEAARRHGSAARPMVSVDGWPTAPALMLLDALARAGTPCRYHGDVDWTGLAIAADLMRRFPLAPWRLSADELAACADRPGPLLEGAPVDTPWDPALRAALIVRGCALHEETVIDRLLADVEP